MANLLFVLTACFLVFNVATSFYIDSTIQHDWELFKKQFNKNFRNKIEEKLRFETFAAKLKEIEKHNKLFEEGKVSFKKAVNEFTDMTFDEFIVQKGGLSVNRAHHKIAKGRVEHVTLRDSEIDLPEDLDWRTKGAVAPVKDQKQCGSCWAFSAVGALEGQHFMKTGQLVRLSEQNLVDCSWLEGNNGCFGGLMTSAFQYVKHNDGIAQEQYYPYLGFNFICRYLPFFRGTTVIGYSELPEADEEELKTVVALKGPISIGFNVQGSFQDYAGGIYQVDDCDPKGLNHGMLAVGYGTTENGDDYWLIKNSWGPAWGEEGYARVVRNKNNTCGVASLSSYPVL